MTGMSTRVSLARTVDRKEKKCERRSFDPLEWVEASTMVEGCGRGFEYSPGFEFAARVLEASPHSNLSYAAKQSFTASIYSKLRCESMCRGHMR